MHKVRQIVYIALANFRRWHKNPQIILCFALAFVVCFLLSDKVLQFSLMHDTYLQMSEPFIWTFGDSQSVLTISLLLLLLFSDMPNLSNEVPYFMLRTNRRLWMMGQILYLIMAVFIFVFFIFLSTAFLSASRSYSANMWSDTAAILGYSEIGRQIAVPAYVKVLELSLPIKCTVHVFLLMTGYALTMAGLILFLNLCRNNGGMIGGVLFSAFSILMNPDIVASWFGISMDNIRYANILFGWLSPLNHATYYMHNFGYDNLPRLWMSYVYFSLLSVLFFVLSLFKIKNYSFSFTGTHR